MSPRVSLSSRILPQSSELSAQIFIANAKTLRVTSAARVVEQPNPNQLQSAQPATKPTYTLTNQWNNSYKPTVLLQTSLSLFKMFEYFSLNQPSIPIMLLMHLSKLNRLYFYNSSIISMTFALSPLSLFLILKEYLVELKEKVRTGDKMHAEESI